MKEIELVHKRKPREKHFLRSDGTILAKIYNQDIHYKKNNTYEEIDNTLTKVKDEYRNKKNAYQAVFKNKTQDSLMKIERDGNYIDIRLKEMNNVTAKKKQRAKEIEYSKILPDVDIKYQLLPTKIKETIVLQNKNQNKFTFFLETNLTLYLENNEIIAKKDNQPIFKIEAPYMEDAKGNIT